MAAAKNYIRLLTSNSAGERIDIYDARDSAKKHFEQALAALTSTEPQAAPVCEALDNSQSLLVMILHLAEEYAMFSDRDMSGISKEDWAREGLTKLLTDQIVENRRTLSLSRPQSESAKYNGA
jgi:prophage DNA circulation protein